MMPAKLSSANRLIPVSALLGSITCLAVLLFGFADWKPAFHRLDPAKITRYSAGRQVLQYPLSGLVPGLPLDDVSKVIHAPIVLFENGKPLAHYPTSYDLIGRGANGRYSAIDSRVIFSPSAAFAAAPAQAIYELRVTPRPSSLVRGGFIVAASVLMVIAIWKLASAYGLGLALATSALAAVLVIGLRMPTTPTTIGADAIRFYASGNPFAQLDRGLGTELRTRLNALRFRGELRGGADLPATDCSAGRSGMTVDFSAGCIKHFSAGETALIPAELTFDKVTRIAIVGSALLGLLIASAFRALASEQRFRWLFNEPSLRPVNGSIVLRSAMPIAAALVAIGAVAPYPALRQMSQPSPAANAGLPNRLAYYAE